MNLDFRSDNVAGVSPAIMAALERANSGSDSSYGGDAVTARLTARLRELFETDCAVFPVATGTAANALALASAAPPYGLIYCHHEAHIANDECGAPEFFTGGARLVGLEGDHAKINAAALAAAVAAAGVGEQHHMQPAAVSISQASERGAVYGVDDVAALGDVARRHNLVLHMDGARFANAVAALECSPAAASWKAGVDVLSFGATKNGAMAAEAVIFFRPDLARDALFRRKRGGHLLSKMRFLSAQLEAYVTGDLWLANARHANAMARRLADGLARLPGARLADPAQANEVFVYLPDAMARALEGEGAKFHRWGMDGLVRLVTSFATEAASVDGFLAAAARAVPRAI
jgi:threonine aldolase